MSLPTLNSKGFTLAELLVVIAIMSILIGVSVGSFTGLIGSGKTEAAEFELEAVQTAIDSYMSINLETTITARADADVIASTDSDAPFNTYLRRLPTEYVYSWTEDGTVTQSGSSSGGGQESGPTPIARWSFDEGAGAIAYDSEGTYDGTIIGATWTSDAVSGNALNFDGSGDYIITTLAAPTLTGDYTFEAWVKASSLSTWAGVITSNVNSPNYNGFNLQIGNSQRLAICAMSNGSYKYIRTGWAPTTDVWYHMVGVHDGADNSNTLYVNGSYVNSAVQEVTMPSVNVIIGKFYCNTNNLYLNGIIDEVAIYDEALNATEVQELYEALNPG